MTPEHMAPPIEVLEGAHGQHAKQFHIPSTTELHSGYEVFLLKCCILQVYNVQRPLQDPGEDILLVQSSTTGTE